MGERKRSEQVGPLKRFFEQLRVTACDHHADIGLLARHQFVRGTEFELPATRDLALVQLVTPVTPIERLQMLCAASSGFVYAVTMTGTTGKNVAVQEEVLEYFARVKRVSPLPVCAGFGIRSREQIERLAPHVDGVVVASALVEALERGEDPAAFLQSLR